jgi:hypothetical protein
MMYFIKNCPEQGEHFNKLLVSEEVIILSNRSTVSGHKTTFVRAVSFTSYGSAQSNFSRIN